MIASRFRDELLAEQDRLGHFSKDAGRVYFAAEHGRNLGICKIGHSTDVQARLRSIAADPEIWPSGVTAGPVKLLAVVPGTQADERRLHREFHYLRVQKNREWFRLDENNCCGSALREYIATLSPAAAQTTQPDPEATR